MKTHRPRKAPAGYIAYAMVLATGVVLTLLTIYGFRRALFAQSVQSSLQLRMDYSEREDAILRSIVALVPNRAIGAMKDGSALEGPARDALRWQNIFADAIEQANAASAVSDDVKGMLERESAISGNPGDGAMLVERVFANLHGAEGNIFVTPGVGRTMPDGYPETLTSSNGMDTDRDLLYPVISNEKSYAGAAFRTLRYPKINFGYAKPGEEFLAKRNWWAFSMDLAANDRSRTFLASQKRDFVLSLYEIPSQLAISASSFATLGEYGSGQAWANVTIEGNVFTEGGRILGNLELGGLSSRRGVSIDGESTVAGRRFEGDFTAPGVRESYELATGNFFPISMPSESGRAAFVPINPGIRFFDRFANAEESNTLSSTTWSQYSSGAKQCAMRLTVTRVAGENDQSPTEFEFEYYDHFPARAQVLKVDPLFGPSASLPPGYSVVADNHAPLPAKADLAYAAGGGYEFVPNVEEVPLEHRGKTCYWRPGSPFGLDRGPAGKMCVAVLPERLPRFLAALGADGTDVNHSLAVNVDYVTGENVLKPDNLDLAPGLILSECADLKEFTRGFSLVTNLRLYIGSDFNITKGTAPAGYEGDYYPPCSLFAPQKRFGSSENPHSVSFEGQVGSLAERDPNHPARPLEMIGASGAAIDADRANVNLRPIRTVHDLPPVTMMNWLVLIQERRNEFW